MSSMYCIGSLLSEGRFREDDERDRRESTAVLDRRPAAVFPSPKSGVTVRLLRPFVHRIRTSCRSGAPLSPGASVSNPRRRGQRELVSGGAEEVRGLRRAGAPPRVLVVHVVHLDRARRAVPARSCFGA